MTVPIQKQFDILVQQLEAKEWPTDASKIEVIKYLQRFIEHATPDQKDKLLVTAANRLGVPMDALISVVMGGADPATLLAPPPERVAVSFPKEGWLGEYLRLTEGHEAPDIFHFWVGVAVLSASLKRSIKFDKSYYRVYPNHYIILVSPSGVCRKTTACGIGVDVLRFSETANVISEKITPEGLIEALSLQVKTGKGGEKETRIEGDATAMLFAPELGVFLGRQTYNEDMIDLLTSLADTRDAPFDYITRSKGKFRLRGTAITLLGATTPDWMSEMFPRLAYGGGFMARTLFIHQSTTPRRFAFPRIPDYAKSNDWFVEGIKEIGRMQGNFSLAPEAEAWYENWYKNYPKEQDHLALSHYYERKPDHLIRLGMILAASEGKPMVLTEELFERALALINITEVSMPEAFQRVETTQLGKEHERLLYALRKAGGSMSKSNLLKRIYRYGISSRRLRELTQTLEEAKIISVAMVGKEMVYSLREI
jgi:hypothetical protein